MSGKRAAHVPKPTTAPKRPFPKFIYGLVAVLAMGLYANTLYHEYTLDDAIVVAKNQYVQEGKDGISDIFKYDTFTGFFGEVKNLVSGGRWRPLSLVTLALEIEYFNKELPQVPPKSSFDAEQETQEEFDARIALIQEEYDAVIRSRQTISHGVNILMYGWTAIVLFQVLSLLFPLKENQKWYFSIPVLASALYIAHPLHTEVVANIKGRDEIMTFIGALYALKFSIDYVNSRKPYLLVLSALSIFLGLLSKENAITFLAVIPLALYFFTDADRKTIIKTMVPIIIASGIFLILRERILHPPGVIAQPIPDELMNNPFLGMNSGEKFATIFYTLMLYLKLMFFPHPLTFDYYPYHIPIIKVVDWRFLLSAAMYIGMGIFALKGLKNKHPMSFFIIFYIATLSIVSNLFFPVGVFMNERFIYISSLAWALGAAWFFIDYLPTKWENVKQHQMLTAGIMLFTIAAFGARTIDRNPNWKNDFTLFQHDIEISKNSAKGNVTAGGSLIDAADKEPNDSIKRAMYEKAINHLNHSIELHPIYVDALLLLGNAWFKMERNFDMTMVYYLRILDRNPDNKNVQKNLQVILNGNRDWELEIGIWQQVLDKNPKQPDNRYRIAHRLGSLYAQINKDYVQATECFEIARKAKPKEANVYKDLGVTYAYQGLYDQSLENLLRYEQMQPGDRKNVKNIEVTYRRLGNEAKAKEYLRKWRAMGNNAGLEVDTD